MTGTSHSAPTAGSGATGRPHIHHPRVLERATNRFGARRLLRDVPFAFLAAVLFGTGYKLWTDGQPNVHLDVMILDVACYVAGFAALWMLSSGARRDWVIPAGLIFGVCAHAWGVVAHMPHYGADAILFNHYSANLLLHGTNPYGRSMAPAYGIFDVPQNIVTPTMDGSGLYRLSYPALSFLIYVPFLLAGLKNVIWVSVAAHVASIVLLSVLAPPGFKRVAPFALFLDGSYFDYTVGGITDILTLPPLLLMAYYWERAPVGAAFWLGVACDFKQNAWFAVPFALLAWIRRARITGDGTTSLRAFGMLAAAFAVPNLPFAIANFRTWAEGSIAPLVDKPIPFGSGIVQAISYASVPLQLFPLLSLGVLGCCIGLYAWRPSRNPYLPFIAPGLSLFFGARSLQNYFMYWPLVCMSFAFARARTLEASHVSLRVVKTWRSVAATAAAALVVFAAVGAAGIASESHVRVEILKANYDQASGRIASFDVRLDNPSAQRTAFRLAVLAGTQFTYWNGGRTMIAEPHSQTDVRLGAGSDDAELRPSPLQSTQVVAVDARTRYEIFSATQHYASLDARRALANPGLVAWSGKPAIPRGWAADPALFRTHTFARGRVGARNALLVDLPVRGEGWSVATIAQTIPVDVGTFDALLYPTRDYLGDAYYRAMFALEFIDAADHHYIIAIDSHLKHTKIYHRDQQFTIEIRPGTLNAWNRVRVDFREMQAQSPFFVAPGGTVDLDVSAAVYGRAVPSLRGAFGGLVL